MAYPPKFRQRFSGRSDPWRRLFPFLGGITHLWYECCQEAAIDTQTYQSPFTWRYGSDAMRRVWSEENKRLLWRKLWVALAETQAAFEIVSREQAADLRAHREDVDIPRALEIEAEISHDVMAEVRTFQEQCEVGGGILHLGMTSMDVVDNADALRVRESLGLVLENLKELLRLLGNHIERWADQPVMAFTHLQPAEPTTLGYRLAQYAQDLLTDYVQLESLLRSQKGKGIRGAVGTSASFADLIGLDRLGAFEAEFSRKLGIVFFPAVTQTYPRKQDYQVACGLAGLGASIYKFAFDLRVLQSPAIGELSEPFGQKQVGSSAMPFKRNPIHAEKLDSLARWLAQFPRTAWDNAAHSLLERTLDDSANRRVTLAEGFLIADELIRVAIRIVKGLQINERAIGKNLDIYGPFAATERILMALGKAGADRQEMHERLRGHALAAWGAIQEGERNPLEDRLLADPALRRYLPPKSIRSLMDISGYTGDAAPRARRIVQMISEIAGENN